MKAPAKDRWCLLVTYVHIRCWSTLADCMNLLWKYFSFDVTLEESQQQLLFNVKMCRCSAVGEQLLFELQKICFQLFWNDPFQAKHGFNYMMMVFTVHFVSHISLIEIYLFIFYQKMYDTTQIHLCRLYCINKFFIYFEMGIKFG